MVKTIDDYEQRHYPFEGCFNFRDIGGYINADGQRVRWGQYFRAGRQERMTEDDLAKVEKLGIKTQVDLRMPVEIDRQGRGPLENLGTRYIHNSVLTAESIERLSQEAGITGTRYLHYIDYAPQIWLKLFEYLADERNYPTLVHCVAGKDRTGVTTALILYILGVDRDTVEADYLLTNQDVERHTQYVERNTGLPAGTTRETFAAGAGVRAEAIVDFLDGVESKPGGALGYLKSLGVNDEMQDSIRGILLEDG